jgi:Holliday junction resolvase RusA-like endonuclease
MIATEYRDGSVCEEDGRSVSFSVMGEPMAKERGRVAVIGGHAMVYTPAKTRKAEETFAARAMRFAPPEPTLDALEVELTFVLSPPQSWPKWKAEAVAEGLIPHTTRPDLDNYVKLVLDALNGVFFVDDKQITGIVGRKKYGLIPQTRVVLRRLPPAPEAPGKVRP